MRENKTKYAILGMLSHTDMSGYDIKKAIEQAMHAFWSESNGQIYPIIKKLAEDGLTTRVIERQEGKPDRHVYSITSAGRQELSRWLSKPAELPTYRLEFLLKLFFGQQGSTEDNIDNLKHFQSAERELLGELIAIQKHLEAPDMEHNHANLKYWLLTAKCGVKVHQAYLDWCDEAIAELTGAKNQSEV